MVHFLVNSYGVSVSRMTNDIFRCRNYNPIISSFMTYHRVSNKSNAMGSTCEAGIAYPSGASEFIPVLVRFVLFDLLFYVWCFVVRCSSFCPFSFGHCVACHSSVSGCSPLGVFNFFFLYSLFSFRMTIRTFTSRPSQQFDLSDLLFVNL